MDEGKKPKNKHLKLKLVKSLALNNDIESQIIKIAQEINQSKINYFLKHKDEKEIDFMRFIQYILVKRFRSKEDKEVLIEFLKSLEKFMPLIYNDCSNDLINEMLIRVSKNLNLLESQENSILFRTGEKGFVFFIIIKGSVSVLIPKILKVKMTADEYLDHLCFLNQMNENELQVKTSDQNKEVFEINLLNPSQPKIVNLANKTLENYTQREVFYNSVEDYVNCLMPRTPRGNNNNSYYPYVNILVYHKVANLVQGNTLGETALLSKDQRRTATIYVNEDTVFGTLNEFEFNMSLKTIQLQTKRDKVLFVMSFNLFNSFSFEFFVKKYWNNFSFIELKKNDILFHQNDKRDLVYFMREGEIELTSRLSVLDINKILRYLGEKTLFESNKITINQSKKLKIACIKQVSIIGLGDLIDEKEEYFCTATCISKKAELFSIDYKMLKQMVESTSKENQLNIINAEKVKVIVNRLYTFLNIDNFILDKEPYSVIKEKILPAFYKNQFSKLPRLYTCSSLLKQSFPITINKEKRKTLIIKSPSLEKMKSKARLTYQYDKINSTQRKESNDPTKLIKTKASLFSTRFLPNSNPNEMSLYAPLSSIRKSILNSNKAITSEETLHSRNMTEKRKTKVKLTIGSIDIDDKYLEHQAKQISHSKAFNKNQRRMIYSNLTLNPDFTLTTTYNINNLLDYCLMEKDENQSSLLCTQIIKRPRSISLLKKKQKLINNKGM